MLASERHGTGEPLVLVHGVTHRRQAWYPVLDRLVEHREVILVDLPGHGESPDLELRGRSVDDALRDEFEDFLDDQGLTGPTSADRPHIAGNSLGGLVALVAAANGHARSATALSPAGFWETGRQFAYTRALFEQAAVLSTRLGPRTELLARTRAGRTVMYGVLVAHPARVSPDQARGDARAFLRARAALRTLLDAAEPFERDIPADVPTTIAWAGRDLVLPVWQAKVARRRLPHAEHLVMKGVGHVPMTDDPALVAEVLLQGSASTATVAPLRPVGRRRRVPAAGVATA